MIKYIKKISIIIIVLLGIFIVYKAIMTLRFGFIKEGLSVSSPNINFSKKHNLFLNKYRPNVNYLDLDIGKIYFCEVWTDYGWHYKNQLRQIEKDGSKALNITFKNNLQLKKINIANYSSSSLTGKTIYFHLKPSKINEDSLKLIYYKTPHYTENYKDRKKTDSVIIYLIKEK